MLILILLMVMLFGFARLGAHEVSTVSRPPEPPAVAQQAIPATTEPLQAGGGAVTDLAIEPVSGEALYAVANGDLLAADGNGGWQLSGTSPNLETTIVDTRNPDVLWAGTGVDCYRGGGVSLSLMQSTDGGESWTESGAPGLVPLASWLGVGVVIAHDCSGLQVSYDSGASWAMPEGLPLGSQVTAFTVASTPESAAGRVVLVGVTSEGGTTELYRVDLSDSDNLVVEGPLRMWYGFGALEVDDSGAILVGAPQGLLRSEDGGDTWTVNRDGLESTTLAQDPIESFPTDIEPGSFGLTALLAAGGEMYVGGVDGVYHRAEDSDRWTRVVELDQQVAALALEQGTGDVLIQPEEGDVLRVVPQR